MGGENHRPRENGNTDEDNYAAKSMREYHGSLLVSLPFHVRLEIKLVLHVEPVFDEIPTEPRQILEGEPIRSPPAASHRDIRVIDNESIIVGAVEAVADRNAQFLGQVLFLSGRRIKDAVSDRNFEFARNHVLPHLHIPAPSITQRHRWTDGERTRRDCSKIERPASTIRIPHVLVSIKSFGLDRPALILRDEIQFVRMKVVDAAAEQPAVIGLGDSLTECPVD